jgi:tetratricopeptide (TPR) repeat protein
MRTVVLCCSAILWVANGGMAWADDGDKARDDAFAIIKTQAPVMIKRAKGELVKIVFPVVRTTVAKGGYVHVVTVTGCDGWIEKAHLVAAADAVADFDNRIKDNPNDADGYFRRGLARSVQGNDQDAVRDFDDAIRLDPTKADYFIGRGQWHYARTDYVKASADLAEAIRLDPISAMARYVRGQVHAAQKKWQDAVGDYSETLRLVPDFFLALEFRAQAWERLGELDKAIGDLSKVVDHEIRLPFVLPERARLRVLKKDLKGALADYNAAVEYNPQFDAPIVLRGTFFYGQRRYAEAMADYEAAIRLNPNNFASINNLAWILATCPDDKLRDGLKAVQLAKKACELDGWKHSMMLGSLAAAHAEVGQFEEAIKWQQKAVDLADVGQKSELRSCLEMYKGHRPKRD